MKFQAARAVADAVLFESYALYPYRASALKNQLRWQIGVLSPRAAVESARKPGDGRRWWLEAQCLLESDHAAAGTPLAMIDGQVRFLQACRREIQRASTTPGAPMTFLPVPSLEVAGRLLVPWDEADVREVDLSHALSPALSSASAHAPPASFERALPFGFPEQMTVDLLRDEAGAPAGRVTREQRALSGLVRIAADRLPGQRPLYRLRVRVENVSAAPATGIAAHAQGALAARDEDPLTWFIGAHLLLAVSNGAFVSLLDPPPSAREGAAACRSDGTYPVLAGPPERRDLVLSAPIILYDHPSVAPESPGDLFDATEIDEILTLRTLTLTDAEKREARATDPRAAALIDRIDAMPPETLARLHGALRALRPTDCEPAPSPSSSSSSSWPSPPPWSPGDRVRLRPGARRADAQDMFLEGQIATVEKVMTDVDGRDCLAVLLDADPATELLRWHGRHLHFYPDEVEAAGDAIGGAPPALDGAPE